MSDMMTFPDTWEEFEKLYGFNDVEEIYTNNSRLIPSFRVKQWLDHLPSVQPKQKWETCFDCPLSHGCPKINGCTNRQTMEYASEVPDDCPISVQPRKGKWIRTRTMTHDGELYCDQCEQEHPEQKIIWNFCPNCGADMRGEGDSDGNH